MNDSQPKINYCIVCDDVRTEIHNKITLLGFFGVTPDVEIIVKDFNKPIEKITFVISAGKGKGSYPVSCEILDYKSEIIKSFPEKNLELLPDKGTTFGIVLNNITYPGPGKYTLKILLGKETFTTYFHMLQGKPEDFGKPE